MTDPNISTAPLVVVERDGPVAILVMADALRRNALSVALVRELIDALRRTQHEGAQAVVLTSREKAFCAGADIREMLDSGWLDAASDKQLNLTPPDLFEAIEHETRPIIAAVDGLALGGGVELCISCDLVLASGGASFALPELGLGVLPNTALSRLAELIGGRSAMELVLTRRRIDAIEAQRLGLINTLVAASSAIGPAVEVARAIVEGAPPTALAAAKRAVRRGRDWSATRAILTDMDPEEWREGTSAFLEKRRPDYARFWEKSAAPELARL